MPKIVRPPRTKPCFSSPLSNIGEIRRERRENQTTFWKRFGLTQSAGSRYENDARNIPTPVKMLVLMFVTGLVEEAALEKIRKTVLNRHIEGNRQSRRQMHWSSVEEISKVPFRRKDPK